MRAPSAPASSASAASPLSEYRRFISEFLQHAFEQPALHRIVVGNKNSPCFLGGLTRQVVPFRVTLAEEI